MAKAKVFIAVGHGGNDSGAVGYITEKTANLVMALAMRTVLERHGVLVLLSRTKDENDDVYAEIRECNNFAPVLAIAVHNNAGGGDGFEAYCHIGGGLSRTAALAIEAEVKKIGQNSRGVKTKTGSDGWDYYAFIRETACPAVICEGVFVDTKKDAAQADTVAEQQAFGIAYAKGVLKALNIPYQEEEKKPAVDSGKLYRVQVGAYTVKANAETQLKNVQKAGFKDAVIVAS